MFKTWNLSCLRCGRALSFGHFSRRSRHGYYGEVGLNFEDLEFVCGLRLENSTDFDIRISNFFSAISVKPFIQSSSKFKAQS